ncbi:hypothetical protein DUI87_22770 [Hirundo rustica rustica]|uniref:ribonuclease H n=1 Tax=Hirundo rustica rustica TaxID=333673 RepID=A0A3M0JGB9_HIRRU|nr:hypothetical protein DUI87_22770 [Hirundo rustica rustica]
MHRQTRQAWRSLWSLRNTGFYRPGLQFSPLDSKIPLECCEEALNRQAAPRESDHMFGKLILVSETGSSFCTKKGQSQAKGVIGKERKGALDFCSTFQQKSPDMTLSDHDILLHPDVGPTFRLLSPYPQPRSPKEKIPLEISSPRNENLPSICQWYLSSLLAPVRTAVEEAIILHYMDDVLVCAPNDDLLSHVLDLTIDSLVAAGFKLQEEKIQRRPPWKYLGLEIGKRTIVPQKLVVKNNIKTLADVQQLCGFLNWVKPWLGLTTEDLDPLYNLLKGGEELSSSRTLTQEARAALEKVQDCMATRQANRCKSDLPFKIIILGKLPHLHGMIFQWERVEKPKKDKDCRDPLLIIAWVFLSHHRSKRMTRPQELEAELIRKARTRIRELTGCDFECIHIPIEINSGQIKKAMLDHLIHEN